MKIDSSKFNKRMSKLLELPQDAMDDTFPFYKNKTPVRSGNARNKTKKNRLKINSNYPYAGRLDEGWSKQAPKGFTSPSIDFLENTVNKLASKI